MSLQLTAMGPIDAANAYAARQQPTAAELANSLDEIGEAFRLQFYEVYADPTPEGCMALSINLAGAQRALGRLREALHRESGT